MTSDDEMAEGSDSRAAFRTVYHELHPQLAGYVARRVRDPHAARDICQETWVGYFRRFDRYQQEYKSKAAPLFAIAAHKVADWRRQQPPYVLAELEPESGQDGIVDWLDKVRFDSSAAGETDPTALVATRVDIARAVARLSDRQREAVRLFYIDDLDQETVAKLMGIGVRAVKGLLARAIETLRSGSILAGYERRSVISRVVRK